MKFIQKILTILAILGTAVSSAQQTNDQILLTIGSEKILRSEFERIYLKNNQVVSDIDQKSVEEYLDLFVNYKLKVIEALNMKLDTTSAFKNELSGYRQQLARPYMTDQETEQQLINEAYERMKFEVSASHILIAIPEQATPLDTAKLYEKTISIRNRIINGEPFEVVARATSDDPSVKNNNGLLGYFTVFQMVYPFESAVFNTNVSELSMPIRTRYGYHLIKVHDKRPARGQVKVAHIMVSVPKDATQEQLAKSKEKIQEIYKQAINNEDFGKLANQFSEDPGSSKNNGELPWFGPGSMIPEFEKVAFSFNRDGQISEPFQSPFGWHIVKRLSRKEIGSFEEMLPEIKKKLSSDMRNTVSIEKMILKIKNDYGFKEDTLNLFPIASLLDSSFYKGSWSIPTLKENKAIFVIADQKHDQKEFVNYLYQVQRKPTRNNYYHIVKQSYSNWVNQTIYNFQETQLEKKYPDFRYLIQEYHDGILLFNLTDMMVWSKASQDSVGLEDFYQKNKESYRWGERVHYAMYTCDDIKTSEKVSKMVVKRKSKGMKPEDIVAKFKKGNVQPVKLDVLVTNPDDASISNYKSWKNGISSISEKDGKNIFYELLEVTTGDIKSLSDARGQVISDYQLFLETDWLKQLRGKYPTVVNQEIFKQVVDSLNKK
ncbi:MAG: peptidylprolyl isomerase [Tenuifilaceae bacterium]